VDIKNSNFHVLLLDGVFYMLLTYRKKFGLTIADVYFFGNKNLTFEEKPDIVFYLQRDEKVKGSTDFYTLHIDLLRDDEQLFSEINRTSRYHINRAIKQDSIKYCFYKPKLEDVLEFSNYYNIFAASKRISQCNITKLIALTKNDGLFFSKVLDKENNILCYHANIVDEKRARLLYSASHFRESYDNEYRALVGRANKYLHWNDIISFKKEGLLIYDFGGIEMLDEKNSELQNIARFKKAFGGEIVHEYNLIEGKSILGKMIIKTYNLIKMLRKKVKIKL
jgi:hypothetical protein